LENDSVKVSGGHGGKGLGWVALRGLTGCSMVCGWGSFHQTTIPTITTGMAT
jgi:hypothetical protein